MNEIPGGSGSSAVMAVYRKTILLTVYYSQDRLNLNKDRTKAAFSMVDMKSILLCVAANIKTIPVAEVVCV